MRSMLDLPEAYVRPEWRACPVPGRPWWHAGKEAFWTRRSGPDAWTTFGKVQRSDGNPEVYRKGDDLAGVSRALTEACIAYDHDHPLPHPGYRVGDLWMFNLVRGEPRVFLLGAREVRLLTAKRAADFDASYLIASLARPDLAPWSST